MQYNSVHMHCEPAELNVFLWADKSELRRSQTNNLQLRLVGAHVCTVYVVWPHYVWCASSRQKRRKGYLEECIKLSAISVHFIVSSLNRILHTLPHHTAAQQYNCTKKKIYIYIWKTGSATATEFLQPGVSCAAGKHYPTELGDASQNAPWHKCRQQPSNIPSASLQGNTAWASKRDEPSKRGVWPRGEQRENRAMAFAQSFDLSL